MAATTPAVDYKKLKVGDKVFAMTKDVGAWLAGTVASLGADDTCKISLTTGQVEEGVTRDKVQLQNGEFKVGDRIEANWKGLGKYYPGKIGVAHYAPAGQLGDTYFINYEDGDTEDTVPALKIRHLAPFVVGEPLVPLGTLKVGDRVMGNWKTRGTFYPGRLSAAHPVDDVPSKNDTFDIQYDDGDFEANVTLDRIKLQEGGGTGSDAGTVVEPTIPKGTLKVGDRVEANWKNRGTWYGAVIEKDAGNDMYDILYDDSAREQVPLYLMRIPLPALAKGDKITANWQNRGTFYPGTIVKVKNGFYNILYDDGDVEADVPRDKIKNDVPIVEYKKGQKIQANFQGAGVFYPGKIFKVLPNNCYNIIYDEGDVEAGVPHNRIREHEEVKADAASGAGAANQANRRASVLGRKSISGESYDFFISHNWGFEYEKGKFDNHVRASRLNDELQTLGAKTWFDQDRLSGDIVDEMCLGIEHSRIIIVCITELYIEKVRQVDRKNDNCKLEFKYASQNKSGFIIPVVMEASCLNAESWKGPVGMVLSNVLYENFSNDSNVANVAKNLISRLEKVKKT